MLSLPEPYGYEFGVHVSLLTDNSNVQEKELVDILNGYSCYQPAIPKIINCLKYSGRYDCVLQPTWFIKQRKNVIKDLASINIKLKINREFSRE